MIATIRKIQMVKMKRGAEARVAKAKAEGLCVACMQPLDDKRTIRGCHERCYRATKRSIDDDLTTEEQRVSEGKLLPPESGGRPVSNPVMLDLLGQ